MMATVSTGILSPNSYGLNPDQVAAKMAAVRSDEEFNPYTAAMTASPKSHPSHYRSLRTQDSRDQSSDSDEMSSYMTRSPREQLNIPKRNKRKNFKPRCSTNLIYSSSDFENPSSENLSPECDNNNSNNRRRKTASTRKVIVDSRFFPMDLSKNNESSEFDSGDEEEEDGNLSGENDENSGSENGSKIPNSFSIHNLSKPHVQEQQQPQNHLQSFGNETQHPQMAEMREYAMNTMKELLGIYGLPSEVTESISKQLPIAAFNSGKIFENLSLHHQQYQSRQNRREDDGSHHQPPTPPSTPLSPKSDQITNNKYTSFIPNMPNISITSSSQNFALKSPLHLIKKHQTQQQQNKSFTNGGLALNLSSFGGEYGLTASSLEEMEEERDSQKKVSGRGIFPASLHSYPQMKTENSSSPPLEQSPLNAMIAQSLAPTTGIPSLHDSSSGQSNVLLNKSTSQLDYSKYVKRFTSATDCGSSYCKDLNYREHFHCLDCNSRVFIKKEEMIRHFKWHKKRDESLQHGFMRYSPLDDCSDRFANCTHNKKQTHYHCIKEGCDKVYISTSDVQMHANYHRKDSAIIQEGFQRYRATEECGASYCAFFGQRTTHFHCRRSGCRFTFKNKSDMEKHKSYHIKDEQLSRDGFKKFMKNEICPFENCRFSRVCNHIHCIRPQCSYVLHSSGQLFSHKRKHERKDSELAYRKYKLAQSMMKTIQDGPGGGAGGVMTPFNRLEAEHQLESLNLTRQQIEALNASSQFEAAAYSSSFYPGTASNTSNCDESLSERNSPVSYDEESTSAMDLTANDSCSVQDDSCADASSTIEDFWKRYCRFYGKNEPCRDNCELGATDHFHCTSEGCDKHFSTKDGIPEHARNHELQKQITETYFTTVTADSGNCAESCIYGDKEKHYHCNWDNCREVILPSEKTFRRLEHYKMHEYSKKLSLTKDPLTMTHLATSIDGMFCRKRGRPPKNRVIEVWNDYASTGNQSMMDSPQAIFTSFKLPKPSATIPSGSKDIDSNDDRSSSPNLQDYSLQGFEMYEENAKCSDNLCPYLGALHFHCNQNRCLYVTDKEDVLIIHSRDFHDNIEILDNFEFYDRNVDCRLTDCPSNKVNRHFHCTKCNYSFVQYSTMTVHNQKHVEDCQNISRNEISIKREIPDEPKDERVEQDQTKAMNLSQSLSVADKISVVKASGTFYPLSSVPTDSNKSTELSKKLPNSDQELMGSNTLYGPELSCSRPFCKLKRKYHYHCNACNQAFSEMDKLVVHIAKHSSGALNSQCQEDNNNDQRNASSPNLHLAPSTSSSSNTSSSKTEPKINVAPLQSLQNPILPKQEHENNPYLPPQFDPYTHFSNFPANLQFALMSQQQGAFLPQSLYPNAASLPQLMFQHSQLMQSPLLPSQAVAAAAAASYQTENLTSPLAAMAANLNKRALSPHHELSPEQKKARIQNSMRILKDEPVPEGYLRFRFNEDCHYQHCGYREHQTHFHCQRQDCGYSFCDKTRFVQHTARHERLDTLMGGDFQQYRANVACGRPDCAYTANLGNTQNKASHFHCMKCDFVCTDTNKVVAHRRQHQKLDSIQAAGFEKFTPSQHCRVINCQHSGKQTHYHCLQCQYAVLGLAQMSAHKYRHMDG